MCENIYPTTYLTWQNKPQNDVKWTKGRGGPLKKMKTKVTIKALKEIPHGFGVLKYFYAILFILKDLKASETHANYSNPCVANSECQQQSDVLEEK